MAIIKCKMCGGDVEIAPDKTFGTCEYCGSTMTFPKVDDDQRAAAFNRGNHFRRIGEFDKALQVYERIVREDENDAEAHWCCALCRFGIEYVEDPASFEYIPTCHRASFDNFLEDVDYLAAVEHSDGITRRQYQKDGAKIAEVQRGILATSQNEEPYDVFICYKETDENGDRTRDSAMAQDIYYQLTEQGRRVFFARITLEDKVGAEYEPYIFAALHSAKVMVVVGTSAEHLNAVWVKNEWSRFLAMMKQDRNKILLPCYRDMDPYDLPEQLSVLQSYDMGKIGFIQDLIRGISKVLDADKQPEVVNQTVKETVVVQQAGGSNADALLKRGYMALEDREWKQALDFFEEVLNQNAECAEAYLGKVLVNDTAISLEDLTAQRLKRNEDASEEVFQITEDEAHTAEMVRQYMIPNYLSEEKIKSLYRYQESYSSVVASRKQQVLTEHKYWETHRILNRVLQFGENDLKNKVNGAINAVYAQMERRIVYAKQQEIAARDDAMDKYSLFLSNNDLKVKSMHMEADNTRNQAYELCCKKLEHCQEIQDYQNVKCNFEFLGDYRESKANARKCADRISEIEAEKNRKEEQERLEQERQAEFLRKEKEKQQKKRSKIIAAVISAAAVAVIIAVVIIKVVIPGQKYAEAEQLLQSGNNLSAAIMFGKCGSFKDARERSFLLWEKNTPRETIGAGYGFTACIRNDGTVMAIGDNNDGQCNVSDWTDIVAVCTTGWPTVGLRSDGTLLAVGKNNHGQCNISQWKNVVAVSGASFHTVGLRNDGTVVATKYIGDQRDYHGQCEVSDWTDIVAVSAGTDHTVGLRSDGTVVVTKYTGDQGYYHGQCDVSNWTNIVAISAADDYTVGLRDDGTVVTTDFIDNKKDSGWNHYRGQCEVSDWTDIVAVSAGGWSTVGLRSNGTVVAVGDNYHGQCNVADWTDIVAISAGLNHTIGLRSDGTVVAVGKNDDGQCRVSGWTDIKHPQIAKQ